jgi:5-methylcytosine-specific restriction endonuclease McrA
MRGRRYPIRLGEHALTFPPFFIISDTRLCPLPNLSMSEILDKVLTLSLNRHWAAIGMLSTRKALVAMCSEHDGEKAAMALDIEMGKDENGEDIMIYANPVDWDTWLALPIRDGDLFIQSAKQRVRVPTVIVSAHFDRMPMRRPRLSSGAIFTRDKGICQYTGKKLPRNQMNIDHVIPRDRGGRDSWDNLVVADMRLNSLKGNRLNHEVGLSLIRKPVAPPSLPVSATITEAKHPTWKPFLL